MIPYLWQDWFLSVKNKNNFVEFPIKEECSDMDYTYFTTHKHLWKIYLNGYGYDNQMYATSSLVEYDENEGIVKTKSGSTYKLGNALNDFQIQNLKNYFEKN